MPRNFYLGACRRMLAKVRSQQILAIESRWFLERWRANRLIRGILREQIKLFYSKIILMYITSFNRLVFYTSDVPQLMRFISLTTKMRPRTKKFVLTPLLSEISQPAGCFFTDVNIFCIWCNCSWNSLWWFKFWIHIIYPFGIVCVNIFFCCNFIINFRSNNHLLGKTKAAQIAASFLLFFSFYRAWSASRMCIAFSPPWKNK